MKIFVKSSREEKEKETAQVFLSSDEPIYLGVRMKPAPGVWEKLMGQKTLYLDLMGKEIETEIKYRIEVGDSTIFFVTGNSKEMEILKEELGA
ncbi:hypothetical protein [Caldiplasma sukawensis]